MSDRHQELRRQHELLSEHLAWLEREILRESALTPEPQPHSAIRATPAPTESRPTVVAHVDSSAATADADALLKSYAKEERHDPKAIKKGCLLAFGLSLGLLVIAVATIYFLVYANR